MRRIHANEDRGIAVFTLIGASTVALPTLAYLVMGVRAQPSLDAAKAWLSVNNTAVMAVLFLVLGFTLPGKGLGGLLQVPPGAPRTHRAGFA